MGDDGDVANVFPNRQIISSFQTASTK